MLIWLKMSWGQFPLLSVKVTCLNFSSFIFIFHLRVHFSILWRWICRFAEAVMEFEWLDRMAVSSAKVLRMYLGVEGCRPCRVYIGRVPVRFLVVLRKAYGLVVRCYYCMWLQVDVIEGRIVGCCSNWEVGFAGSLAVIPGSRPYRKLGLHPGTLLNSSDGLLGFCLWWLWVGGIARWLSGLYGIRIGGTGSSLRSGSRLVVCVIKVFQVLLRWWIVG
jgi:hypothetical protein